MTAATHHLWTEVMRVPFSDMDTLGHASHLAYFRYMQEARVAWVRSLADRLPREQAPVVVAASCNYVSPVVHPATLEITMTSRYGQGAARGSQRIISPLRPALAGPMK